MQEDIKRRSHGRTVPNPLCTKGQLQEHDVLNPRRESVSVSSAICLCFEEIFEVKSFLVEPETLNTKSPKFKPQWNQVLEIVAPSNSKEKNVATSGLFKLTRLGLDMSTFWRTVTPPTRQHFRIPPADRLSKG